MVRSGTMPPTLCHAITVAEKWSNVQTFSAHDLGDCCAALGRQAVFLEVARGLVGNRPLNQSSGKGWTKIKPYVSSGIACFSHGAFAIIL